MVPHRSRSNRSLTVLGLPFVLAATLLSCGRGADTPPASNPAAAAVAAPAPAPPPPPPRELTWSKKVDMKLWSTVRVKAYKAALQQETPPTLAILRIPRLELEVPVYDGTTDAVLDLAAGRIEDTALPGTRGQRRHRGPSGRLLPGAEGHQGRRRAGAGHTRCDRAIPGRVDPDHCPDRRQRDRPDARSGRDARRLLPVLLPGLGAAAVHRARGSRAGIACGQLNLHCGATSDRTRTSPMPCGRRVRRQRRPALLGCPPRGRA